MIPKKITKFVLTLTFSLASTAILLPQISDAAYYNWYNDYNQPSTNQTANQSTTQTSSTLADRIIQTGEKYMGTPYQYGAKAGQTRTFDCSSFTQYVFKQNGITLPRSSRQQATIGKTVSKSQLKKGDLLFFTSSSSGGKIGHVGIYAGNNKILHTYGSGGVRYDSLSTKWLERSYVTAKRVIQ
ncbi:Cell wall-associated hydrolase, NlpC family [Seinonella peptonophila]|uniref:Cell wall-associated hydrolase, NlpC family n=1 Tax=Seinonella peptonophila TaxID=112248 RepID=A0A1M4W592_9BACL|nr:C40 family peptidase [Seinonella peptonophila]SHE76320.1 Cell wall-associated hydrolase, NlpC family [Seinonella peptonophila]